MKDRVRKIINFQCNHYKDTERKLEKLAAEGLFLEKCGGLFWTFRKGDPKKLTYTITFTHLLSVLSADNIGNQKTYVDYAKESGWNLVSNKNQIQIFCSDADNPIPLEMDEKEKFDNIKGMMSQGFMASIIMVFVLFVVDLVARINSIWSAPAYYLSNKLEMVATCTDVVVISFYVYLMIDYYVWYKRSKRAVDSGGACVGNRSRVSRILGICMVCLMIGDVVYCVFLLGGK